MANFCAIVLAAILSGLLGVIVTLRVQNRALKRAEKQAVFKTLMETRFITGPSYEKTRAFNAIEVTFYGVQKVLVAWVDLYEYYAKSDGEYDKAQDKMIKLLQTMAYELGYKNLDWTTIKSPYIPNGIYKHLNDSVAYQELQLELMTHGAQILRQWTNKQAPDTDIC